MINKLKIKIYNLLRWSEKYTQTDMIYLAKGGFWLTLGRIISTAASFLLAIAFANLLDPVIYGNYKYILSLIGILTIFSLSGMGTAITQAVARGLEGSLIPALKTKIRWGLLGGLTGLILAGYYFYQGNITLTISFLISAAFLPFMDSLKIYDSLLNGRKLFKISTKYFIISQIIAVASLITVLFFTKNLFLILLTYFTSWTTLRFIFLKLTLKKFLPNKNQDPKAISYGKHLSFIKGLNTIAGNVSNIFIFNFLGSQPLAIFSFAIAPIEQIRSLIEFIEILTLPKFSQDKWKIYTIKLFFKKAIPFLILLTLGIILYIILAPWFYKIFFPQYISAIILSQIYSISLIFTGINIFQISILKANRASQELHILNILDILLKFILVIPMIYYFKLIGLVYALILIKIVEMILMFYFIFINKHFIANKTLNKKEENGNLENM